MLCILAKKIKDFVKHYGDLSFSNTDENWFANTEHIKCSIVVLYKYISKVQKVILVQKKINFF